MTSFHPLSIFMDARRVTRGTPEMIAARQQERLAELVRFARAKSRFYAEKYRGLPESVTAVSILPPVTKAELMEHFLWIDNDASVAAARDPAVRAQVADEIADVTGAVLALCNALDLDLSEAVRSKMARNELKYPVEKARGKYRIEE